MNYYIADTHFGCTNSYEGRTLGHDKLIKENWNKTVNNNDTVYILGDIGRVGNNKDNEYLCRIVSTLKGKKVLITGNHDNIKDTRIKQLFKEIVPYKEITDNYNGMNHKLVLSHYPILFWNGQHKGYIHLYGHVHNTDEYEFCNQTLGCLNEYFKGKIMKGHENCPECKAFNVGCILDYMNYTPRTLKEIMRGCKK